VLPIEEHDRPQWPQTYLRRHTRCKAWRVSSDTLPLIAQWCGGHTWASSVVVPIRNRNGTPGEASAAIGDVVVEMADNVWAVWPGPLFDAEWTGVEVLT
jgi:hypothetical protein